MGPARAILPSTKAKAAVRRGKEWLVVNTGGQAGRRAESRAGPGADKI